MLPILLRIHPDEWFAARMEDGVPIVGVWLPCLLWALYAAVSLRLARRADETRGDGDPTEVVAQRWVALAGFGALLSLPLWIGAVLPKDFAGVPVFGYGVMIFCGFAAAGWTGLRRARRAGLPDGLVYDLTFWAFAAGIGGARLNYLLRFHDRVFAAPEGRSLSLLEAAYRAVNLTDGGLVLLGGVVGAALAFTLVCRRWKVSALLVADVAIPSAFLGLAFGRIGCLMYGCCWGDRCELPWAIHFPEGGVTYEALVGRGFLSPDAPRTYGLHPTQLYSSFNALVLSALTAAYFPRRPRNGAVLALALLTYPPARATLEALRGDDTGFLDTGLTHAQTVAIILFALGVLLAAWLTWGPREPNGTASSAVSGSGGRGPGSVAG
ncbi:prolipoprotein diacylglyceryl transferase [Alienimonas californiensis]|uniref:Phosphatidylglycerol--prolipoprotein diacylglyceryl transferase n=1 Tax=Alienimonas californiensis TaxID=2527989 RepID=A0A517PEU0_9PLAN|nr:prolipoprotein diacylglyceryl transferase family protein [Alienimonas californiensis]QDT17888.1 Prolipoprotein diacylglyceryl transferase [Alienimonas californiensis]